MNQLFILFDGQCDLCNCCREWLKNQPAYYQLIFIPFQSPEIDQLFPGIRAYCPDEELVIVSNNDMVYKGMRAWIMCLYALIEYREWAFRLTKPVIMPFAKRVVTLISTNRLWISGLFRQASNDQIAKALNNPYFENKDCSTNGVCSR